MNHDRTEYEAIVRWAESERGKIWLAQLEHVKPAASFIWRFICLMLGLGITFGLLLLSR